MEYTQEEIISKAKGMIRLIRQQERINTTFMKVVWDMIALGGFYSDLETLTGEVDTLNLQKSLRAICK